MTTLRLVVISLLMAMLIALLALCPVLPVKAQSETATATYTPIPTRTQTAATQVVTIIQIGESGSVMIDRSVTYGDVYVVTAIAALFALGALYWAYQWVKAHVRTQEQ